MKGGLFYKVELWGVCVFSFLNQGWVFMDEGVNEQEMLSQQSHVTGQLRAGFLGSPESFFFGWWW